uniref:Uncharacterized protein n=1 Tax=Arundo donax TaxID=35708 RepID=A0A0A9C028_ARUDO
MQVTAMEAEYFPPRELVILQNEAPTDVYILVSGAVVSAFIVLMIVIFLQFPNVHACYHLLDRKNGL